MQGHSFKKKAEATLANSSHPPVAEYKLLPSEMLCPDAGLIDLKNSFVPATVVLINCMMSLFVSLMMCVL